MIGADYTEANLAALVRYLLNDETERTSMTFDQPKYTVEVQHPDFGIKLFTARGTADEVLRLAQTTYRQFNNVIFQRPRRVCVHPLTKLIPADKRSVSVQRATRDYQCSQCGDYISVTVKT